MAGYKAVRHCPSTALLPAVPGLCYVKAGKALQLQTDWFPFTQRTPDTAQIVHLNTCLSMLLLFPQRKSYCFFPLRGRSKSLLSQWATSQHHNHFHNATILSLETLGRPWLCDPHSVALPTLRLVPLRALSECPVADGINGLGLQTWRGSEDF